MTGKFITGTIVGALVLFLVGFLWYGLLPIGSSSFKPLPNESAVLESLKSGDLASGTYVYPHMTQEEMGGATSMQEWQQLHATGPMFEVRYHREGVTVPDAGMFVGGFVHFLVSALIAAFILLMALPLLTTYGKRLTLFIALGLFAGIYTHVSGPIWMYYPWDRAMMDVLASVVSWTLAGAAMAAIIKPRMSATTVDTAQHRQTVTAAN